MRTVNVSIGGENHEVSEALARGIRALITCATSSEAAALGVDFEGRCYYANAFNEFQPGTNWPSYAGVCDALNAIHNARCQVPRRLPAVAVTLDERAWRDTRNLAEINDYDDIPF